jgi:Tol biopolymer transport system component/ferric-dicitrate binding protein FerR (iron transport regulator)
MISAADLDLLQAYLDRRLDAAASAALEVRLQAEPLLAETLVTLAREEAILCEWAKGTRALEGVGADNAPLEETTPSPVVSGPGQRRRWLLVGSAVAAAAALAALATLLRGPPWDVVPPVALAVLEEVQGDVYVIGSSGRLPAHPGQELFAGAELGTSGDDSFAAVKYPDNTRLELGADTRVSFEGKPGRRVVLEEGVLTGQRSGPAGMPPMALSTPHAEALVRGSQFSFTTAGDSTLVEMQDGGVYLKRRSDGKAIDLPAGSLVVTKGTPFKPRPLVPRRTQYRAVLDEGTGPVAALAWRRDGKTIATGSSDGTVQLWDVGEREVRLTLHGHKRGVRGLAFAPDGSWLVSVTDEKAGHLRVWDAASGTEQRGLKAPKGVLQAVAISPNGKTIATGGTAGKDVGEVRLWDAATGAERGVLHGHVGDVIALVFSPDGRWLATAGSKDNLAKLWDLTAMREVHTLANHVKRVNALAFSPDGRTLATGSRDGTVRLWDVATGEELRTLASDARDVRALAFSRDGHTLAIASGDLVRLWDVPTGGERVALKGHKNQVLALAFSPDGKTLASAGWDRTVKLWDVP